MFIVNYFIGSTENYLNQVVYSEAELSDWIETMFYEHGVNLVITTIRLSE